MIILSNVQPSYHDDLLYSYEDAGYQKSDLAKVRCILANGHTILFPNHVSTHR
jgi:hypothetical protein